MSVEATERPAWARHTGAGATAPGSARQPGGRRVPSGVGRRLLAYAVDLLAVAALVAAVFVPTRSVVLAGVVAVEAIVALVLWEARTGRTLGKSLLGLRAAQVDGPYAPGLGRELIRAALLGAAHLVAFVGQFILIATAAADRSGRGQAVHDRAARTAVLDLRPEAAAAPAPVPSLAPMPQTQAPGGWSGGVPTPTPPSSHAGMPPAWAAGSAQVAAPTAPAAAAGSVPTGPSGGVGGGPRPSGIPGPAPVAPWDRPRGPMPAPGTGASGATGAPSVPAAPPYQGVPATGDVRRPQPGQPGGQQPQPGRPQQPQQGQPQYGQPRQPQPGQPQPGQPQPGQPQYGRPPEGQSRPGQGQPQSGEYGRPGAYGPPAARPQTPGGMPSGGPAQRDPRGPVAGTPAAYAPPATGRPGPTQPAPGGPTGTPDQADGAGGRRARRAAQAASRESSAALPAPGAGDASAQLPEHTFFPRAAEPAQVPGLTDAPDAGAGSDRRGGSPSAVYVLTMDDGATVTVTGSGLLGRRPQAPAGERYDHLVAIDDPGRSLSRTHARIGIEDGELWVEDRGSANGTLVVAPDGTQARAFPGKRVVVPEDGSIELGERVITVARWES
ncbi:FHA domain-containing protein [Occultella glacieicola]|uniref:FHA domain-containing protein n=1 Tax=Occultella glacieicola TaxID=2518684 RepID=A0ABY2E4N8_9MICO|nr:RDD family protein [Occultella glacieicola]TDE91728.1 FHA domain-containing protein [Occultella glacieicola]